MFCAYCGTKLEDGTKFCYQCGNQLDSEPDQAVVTPETTSENVQTNTYNPTENASTTPDNAIINNESVVVSQESTVNSAPVTPQESVAAQVPVAEQTPVAAQQSNAPQAPSGFCATCGSPLEPGTKFCFNCGSAVTEDAPEQQSAPIQQEAPAQASAPVQPMFQNQQMAQPNENPADQAPLSVPQESGKKKKKDKNADPNQPSKKSKKGLVAILIVIAVIVLGCGGFLIYSRITLNKLSDSVETFKILVVDDGLENVEKYSSLIQEAEDKADGLLAFGVSDLEKQIDECTAECEELYTQLTNLKSEKEFFENLDQKLIIDSESQGKIDEYKLEFDEAILAGDKDKAQEAIDNLTATKTQIETDNEIYVESLLTESKDYSNPDFDDAKNQQVSDSIAEVQNLLDAGDYVQAKDKALAISNLISELEAQAEIEKENAAIAELSAKPENLTIMINETMLTEDDSMYAFETALEDRIGINLTFDQYSSDEYFDTVYDTFSTNNLPDVVCLTQDMYKQLREAGLLADITEYFENSGMQNSMTEQGSQMIDNLRADGRLYGFSPQRGFTYVTYVRKSWLDQLGMQAPTNYEEFIAMLTAFKENKMGNTKKASDTFGMTAAGLLSKSEPYVMMLQQFYQNAYPEIIQSASGEYYDGFSDQAMVDALARLQSAYKNGLLDPKITTNTMEDAITAFGSGKCGVISLWEGEGADFLLDSLKENGIEDDIIVLDPIAELGYSIGKEPNVLAVTVNCKNPGGVVNYFFKPMLDGGDVQMLWTYGAQGTHWNDIAQTIQYSDDTVIEYQQGQFHMLPYDGLFSNTYNYNYINPLRSANGVQLHPTEYDIISDVALASKVVADKFFKASPYVAYNGTYWDYFSTIQTERENAIQKAVIDGVDPAQAVDEYTQNVSGIMTQILNEMNGR